MAAKEENIKIADSILITVIEVAIAHGKFIEVAEHCQIKFMIGSHTAHLFLINTFIIRQIIQNSNPFIDTRRNWSYIEVVRN